MNWTEEQCEKFEGRVFKCANSARGERLKVVGCDPYIGITIMSEDEKDYIVCVKGPATPAFKRCADTRHYDHVFDTYMQMMSNGIIDIFATRKIHTPGNNASAETCAFT